MSLEDTPEWDFSITLYHENNTELKTWNGRINFTGGNTNRVVNIPTSISRLGSYYAFYRGQDGSWGRKDFDVLSASQYNLYVIAMIGAIGTIIAIITRVLGMWGGEDERTKNALDALRSAEIEVSLWIENLDKKSGGIDERNLATKAEKLADFLSRFIVEYNDILDDFISSYQQNFDGHLTRVIEHRPLSKHLPATDDFWDAVNESRPSSVALWKALENRRKKIADKGLDKS